MTYDESNHEYQEWIDSKEDYLIETYKEACTVFPDSIYERILSDEDMEAAEEKYLDELVISQVPDEYIQKVFENMRTEND